MSQNVSKKVDKWLAGVPALQSPILILVPGFQLSQNVSDKVDQSLTGVLVPPSLILISLFQGSNLARMCRTRLTNP